MVVVLVRPISARLIVTTTHTLQEANLGPRRLLHCLADKKLWTKLRPGVFEFLEVRAHAHVHGYRGVDARKGTGYVQLWLHVWCFRYM